MSARYSEYLVGGLNMMFTFLYSDPNFRSELCSST